MYLSKQIRNIVLAYVKHNPDIFKDFGQTINLETYPDETFLRETVIFLGVHKQDGLIPLMVPDHQPVLCRYLIQRHVEGGFHTDEDLEGTFTMKEECGLMMRDDELSAVIAVVREQRGMEHSNFAEWSSEVRIETYSDVKLSRDWNPGDVIPDYDGVDYYNDEK